MKYLSLTLDQLYDLSKSIADELIAKQKPCCILLYGDLGAGKSTFARMLIKALTSEDTNVPSPTFTLLQTYDTKAGSLTHFDLYRIKRSTELYELGFDEYIENNICLIEWPERLGDDLPKRFIKVQLIETSDDDTRDVIIERIEE